MVWKGSEAAGNQCEQSCEEAWKIRENPKTKREERIRRRVELQKGTESAKGTGKVDGALEGSSVVEWRCS